MARTTVLIVLVVIVVATLQLLRVSTWITDYDGGGVRAVDVSSLLALTPAPTLLATHSPAGESSSSARKEEKHVFERVSVDEKNRIVAEGNEEKTDKKENTRKGKEESSSDAETETTKDGYDPNKPLNILLLYADDWTFYVMGKTNRHVKTPNIDALADDQGRFFTHNAVTTSICWVSRSTLYTGVYASVHEHLKLDSDALFNETKGVPWDQTLFPLLKQHGYTTGLVGKWHANYWHTEMSSALDHMKFYYGEHWMDMGGGRFEHVTERNRIDALEFLRTEKSQQQPFMLTVSFFATHAVDGAEIPYQPQNSSQHLYVNKTIPMPKTANEEHYRKLPYFFQDGEVGRGRNMGRFDTPENYQKNIKELFRLASEVDDVVGELVAELKSQGRYNQTLIMFTTDNGNLMGEHGLTEKWYSWEESVRVPLVIRDPRHLEEPTMPNDFTLSVDLAPTILSAAGVQPPDFMQGRDMAELYLPEKAEALKKRPSREDFFYEWNLGEPENATDHFFEMEIPAVFALIRRDYKYFFWPQTGYEQLFHIASDPFEQHDIINSTKKTTVSVLRTMKKRYQHLKRRAQAGLSV